MKCKFYLKEEAKIGEKDLPLPEFEGQKGLVAVRDVLNSYARNFRQGNASTKDRGAVSGSGKKPYRQKGTGMARHGEKRSPIWTGGGVVFGPKPRNFSVKINQKLKNLALARSLVDRVSEGEVILFEEFGLSEPKTKAFLKFLEPLEGLHQGTSLIVDAVFNPTFLLAARNVPTVFMMDADSLNAWDIAYCDRILLSEAGFEVLKQRLEK